MAERINFYFDQGFNHVEIVLSVSDRPLPNKCATLEREATTLSS